MQAYAVNKTVYISLLLQPPYLHVHNQAVAATAYAAKGIMC